MPVILSAHAVTWLDARNATHGGELTLYSSTQIPHILKTMLGVVTGAPENKIRVIAPDVGGGFGAKLNLYADELLVALKASAEEARTLDAAAARITRAA